MKYDVCFYTIMYPDETAEFYTSEGFLNDSDHITFIQKALIEGMEEHPEINVHIINKLLGHRYSKNRVPEARWRHSDKALTDDISFSYIKAKPYTSSMLFYYSKQHIKDWLDDKRPDTQKVFLAYAITNCCLDAFKYVKNYDSSIKTGVIVPDLPSNTRRTKGSKLLAIKNKIADFITNTKYSANSKHIDRFFLVSDYMAEPLKCMDRYTPIEASATDIFQNVQANRAEPTDKTVILYAGGLHEKYGIKLLVDAFNLLNDQKFVLYLYGYGDYVGKLQELSKDNENIHYGGSIPREELLALELGADVLVNPRPNMDEFLFSCPSKNIEYLSSGVPFIGFKLECITPEYDGYINYPSEETAESLAKKIIEVTCTKKEESIIKATNARTFILKEKGKVAQANKIVNALIKA